MPTNEVKSALLAAKVTEGAITKLDEQGMLDAELLTSSSAGELQQGCGITMGDALRAKKAYPSPVAEHAATALTTPQPVTLVLTTPQPKSDEEILNCVK